jgi:hypothetical protein
MRSYRLLYFAAVRRSVFRLTAALRTLVRFDYGAGPVVVERQVGTSGAAGCEIHHDPETWWVVARIGGAEGQSRRYPAESEEEAREMAHRFTQTNERWRVMPEATAQSDRG